MKIAAIIPAFNEEKTIGATIQAAKGSSKIAEIIVVDDGSTDNTFLVANNLGVKVLKLGKNYGKAQAMKKGVEQTDAPVLIFIDADLIGLSSQQLDILIDPILKDEADMIIGKIDRRNKKQETPKIYKNQHYLSGTRVLKSSFWNSVPERFKKSFYIESAMTYIAKKKGMIVKDMFLENVKHVVKEQKYGWSMGFLRRLKMFIQLGVIFIMLRIQRF